MKLVIEMELDDLEGDLEMIEDALANLAQRLPEPLKPTSQDLNISDPVGWCGFARIVPGKIRR